MDNCRHIWSGDLCLICRQKMCELFPVPPGTRCPDGANWAVTDRGDWEPVSDEDVQAEWDKASHFEWQKRHEAILNGPMPNNSVEEWDKLRLASWKDHTRLFTSERNCKFCGIPG